MKNFVLCFDVGGGTSAAALFDVLEQSDEQLAWYHCLPESRRRTNVAAAVRSAIGGGYDFLSESWEPGDRIFMMGAGRGGYSAHALTHLLGTVGLLPPMWSDLVDFALNSYALQRTSRTDEDWHRVRHLIADLNGGIDVAVPVTHLALWDAVRPAGLPAPSQSAATNVASGRHAIAIDGGPLRHHAVPAQSERVEQVWFRGGHCDVVGGPGACAGLVGISADWMLEGIVAAGARLVGGTLATPSAPTQEDALAGSARSLSRRTLPVDAAVHASVEVYLRAHPSYWRRLPSRVVWADQDWLARGERLVVDSSPSITVQRAELAAAAS